MVRWNLGSWLGQVHKPLGIIDTGGPCNYVAFSPDGKSFATGFTPADHANATPIDLWDTASGAKLRSLPGMLRPVRLRTGRQGSHCSSGRATHGRHRPGHRAGALDDPAVTRPVRGKAQSQSRRFHRSLQNAMTGQLLRGCCDWTPSLASSVESRCEAGAGWPVAPDGSKVATGRIENGEAYIDVHDLPSGRRTASWQATQAGLSPVTLQPRCEVTVRVGPQGRYLQRKQPLRPDLGRGNGNDRPVRSWRDGGRHLHPCGRSSS